jgi:hypothetical protein
LRTKEAAKDITINKWWFTLKWWIQVGDRFSVLIDLFQKREPFRDYFKTNQF